MKNRNVCRNRTTSGVVTALSTASVLALAISLAAAPASALPVRDDIGPDGAVDTGNVWAGVGQMFNRRLNADGTVSTFLCTGQLINPRTVVFAQHCTSGVVDEGYGPGRGNHMGFGFDPLDTFTGFDDWRRDPGGAINNPITGDWESLPDQLFYNVLQVETVFNTGEPFPGGDLALASFDVPVIGLPTYGMLFSPLEGPTHAALVGYGTTGTGSTGDTGGIDFKRRVGENMIDGLYSQADFLSGVFAVPGIDFGVEGSQLFYHIDFDRPDRNPNDCARGEFFGFGFGNDIVCATPPYGANQPLTWDFTSAILTGDHIDWYPGDALPNEAGTAGGDSGSALFADQIYSRPLITGVLSGGWVTGFFSPNGGYGDVSYFNPLFLFRDWLVENNPYVYASAKHGHGDWSNPDHWRQGMDPNYFYIDEHGAVKNGLPSEPEPGYFADRPKWGTVFDLSIPDDIEGATSPETPAAAATAPAARDMAAMLGEPEHGGWGAWSPQPAGPTASGNAPTGPGSSGFVPNNSYGAFGTWTGPEDGVARFYDVTLSNIGVTTLDMNAEIDRLTVSGHLSTLHVRNGFQLNALIAVDQHRGFVNVDGVIEAREYALWGGFLTGNGAINTQTLWNVDGVISAGGLLSVGEMTINGDYVQSSAADMLVNIQRGWGGVISDFIQVNGDASLAGDAIVTPANFWSRPRWNDTYTVLNAENVVGNFDDVHLLLASPILYGDSIVRGNGDVDIVVKARKLKDILSGHPLQSLGEALDTLRWGGSYSAVSNVFDAVDNSSFSTFETTLFSLAPQGAFMQANLVSSFSSGFTSHLTARNSELRAGARGVSFSGLSGAFAKANAAGTGTGVYSPLTQDRSSAQPETPQRFGMFVSSRNFYGVSEDTLYPDAGFDPFALDAMMEGARSNSFQSSQQHYGDLAIGADYRLTDSAAVGVSFSMSRHDLAADVDSQLQDNTNVGMAVYATKYGRNWFLDGYYGFSKHDFELQRMTGSPEFGFEGSQSLTAVSAPDATQTLAGVRAGWLFSLAEGLTAGPMATLNYSGTRFEAYEEFAGGDFNLVVDERSLTSVSLATGAQVQYAHVTQSGNIFSAFAQLSAAHELADDREVITAAFSAAPGEWFSLDRMLDGDWYTATAGVSYSLGGNFFTQIQAGADFDRGPLDQHFATVNLRWSF